MVESAVLHVRHPDAHSARRVSPAAHLAERFTAATVVGPRAVTLREVPFRTMIGVRLDLGSPAARRVEDRLGVALPDSCGMVADAAGLAVVWLAPDEFLMVAPDAAGLVAAGLIDGLVEALDGDPGSATDLSANRTCFDLRGPSARAVLEKGCPLDLHPRAFAPGTAYLTSLRAVPILLWKTSDTGFQIFPRSSFADFLGRWLIDAMTEFAAPELI